MLEYWAISKILFKGYWFIAFRQWTNFGSKCSLMSVIHQFPSFGCLTYWPLLNTASVPSVGHLFRVYRRYYIPNTICDIYPIYELVTSQTNRESYDGKTRCRRFDIPIVQNKMIDVILKIYWRYVLFNWHQEVSPLPSRYIWSCRPTPRGISSYRLRALFTGVSRFSLPL